MILTVTPNAALDRTYTVPGFALDRVNRPVAMLATAGGKGVNVARVFRTLGGEAHATGFLGGRNGEEIRRLLADEGIPGAWVERSGDSRICYQFYDPDSGALTELNESGPPVSIGDCDALTARLRELLPGCEAVVFSGSLPPGAPPMLYQTWVAMAQEEYSVPAVLDTSGEPLRAGLASKPFLVKPNVHELAALSISGSSPSDAARTLRDRFGVRAALITCGAAGAMLAAENHLWSAKPPPHPVVSALGSGDSLAAAFVWAWLRGANWMDALRLGVAAGTANAHSLGAGFCAPAQIFEIEAQVVARLIE